MYLFYIKFPHYFAAWTIRLINIFYTLY
jgi:hypothetical protein